jgi:hypothetical protein
VGKRLGQANVSLESAVRGGPAERTAELARLALGDRALVAEETSNAPVYRTASSAAGWS